MASKSKRCIVFTGWWPTDSRPHTLPEIVQGDLVVCADGGYEVCRRFSLRPDAVIGDFDTLSAELIIEIEQLGIERVVCLREKDDTDTIHSIKYALSRGCDDFLIIGGIGGDIGHTMANIQTLSFLTDMECTAGIVTESERLFMADGKTVMIHRESKPAVPAVFSGEPGAKFSVFSYAERSTGVSIENAKYPLDDAVLTQSYPVGVHNEFVNTKPVTVSVRYGRLLIISDIVIESPRPF